MKLSKKESSQKGLIDSIHKVDKERDALLCSLCPYDNCKNGLEKKSYDQGDALGRSLICDHHQMDGNDTVSPTDGWKTIVSRKHKTRLSK